MKSVRQLDSRAKHGKSDFLYFGNHRRIDQTPLTKKRSAIAVLDKRISEHADAGNVASRKLSPLLKICRAS